MTMHHAISATVTTCGVERVEGKPVGTVARANVDCPDCLEALNPTPEQPEATQDTALASENGEEVSDSQEADSAAEGDTSDPSSGDDNAGDGDNDPLPFTEDMIPSRSGKTGDWIAFAELIGLDLSELGGADATRGDVIERFDELYPEFAPSDDD